MIITLMTYIFQNNTTWLASILEIDFAVCLGRNLWPVYNVHEDVFWKKKNSLSFIINELHAAVLSWFIYRKTGDPGPY